MLASDVFLRSDTFTADFPFIGSAAASVNLPKNVVSVVVPSGSIAEPTLSTRCGWTVFTFV